MPSEPVPPTIVHALAAADPARPLLLDDRGGTTVGVFAELVEGAVADLRAAGMRPGDRLVLRARNRLESAVAIWACARGGFLFAGLPLRLAAASERALLERTLPRLVLAEDPDRGPAGALPVERVLRGRREPWDADAPMPDADDVYALVLTSGTTGTPKAVMVRHRATMHVAAVYRRLLGLTPADVTAIHLPFSSVSGHISQLNPMLLAGGAAVLMPEFAPDALLEVCARWGVTVLDEVPWAFSLLLRRPGFDPARLPALRAAFFGGAPLEPGVGAALRQRFPALALHEVWGSSETAGLVTAVRDGSAAPGRDVGAPVDGVAVRVTAGGELLVRGPVVTPGYFGDEAATAALLRGGWLHTGDLGEIADDGAVRVHGRAVDTINRGGLKVAPQEVELAVAALPGVAEVAAFGVPDGAAGERVAVAVVADGPLTEEDVRAAARAALPEHARPRQVLLLAALDRTATGKIDRAALRRRTLTS